MYLLSSTPNVVPIYYLTPLILLDIIRFPFKENPLTSYCVSVLCGVLHRLIEIKLHVREAFNVTLEKYGILN